jgi:ClpP class serine protease
MEWLREGHWANEKRKKKEASKAAERQREFDEELAAERQAIDDDLIDIEIAGLAFTERQRLDQQLEDEMSQFKEQLKAPAADVGITPVPEGMTPAQHQPELNNLISKPEADIEVKAIWDLLPAKAKQVVTTQCQYQKVTELEYVAMHKDRYLRLLSKTGGSGSGSESPKPEV